MLATKPTTTAGTSALAPGSRAMKATPPKATAMPASAARGIVSLRSSHENSAVSGTQSCSVTLNRLRLCARAKPQ